VVGKALQALDLVNHNAGAAVLHRSINEPSSVPAIEKALRFMRCLVGVNAKTQRSAIWSTDWPEPCCSVE
jgi:hypothetical protein